LLLSLSLSLLLGMVLVLVLEKLLLLFLGGAIGALVYRFVTPGWARGPGDVGGPGT